MFSFKRSFKKRWMRYYAKSNWPIVVDIASVITVFALLALFLSLYFYNPQVLMGPNFSDKKEKNLSDKYVLDVDNLPLELNLSFSDKYLSKSQASSRLQVEMKNSSNKELKDLKIKIISNNNLSISSLELENVDEDFASTSNNEIIINSLRGEEAKSLELIVNWSNINVAGKKINLQVESKYLVMKQEVKKVSSILSPYVESSLSAQSMVLYTSLEGDKLGLGPIPPIANLPTNYWLFWDIESRGALKDFIMSARLPLEVKLTDKYSLLAGDFSYDKENRLIVWKIDKIEEGSGSLRLGLELQLIPKDEQVGQTLKLIRDVKYLAKDSVSGRQISGSLNDVDTNLPRDKFNQGLGIVKSFSEY